MNKTIMQNAGRVVFAVAAITLCLLSQTSAQSEDAQIEAKIASEDCPGIAVLTNVSTDVVVAVPKEVHAYQTTDKEDQGLYITNFTILHALKGNLPKLKVIPLIYGFIHNADSTHHALAKPQFVTGHKYIVFLQSIPMSYVPASSDPHSPGDFDGVIKKIGRLDEADYREVQLTDVWLGVQDDDKVLEETVATISSGTSATTTHGSRG